MVGLQHAHFPMNCDVYDLGQCGIASDDLTYQWSSVCTHGMIVPMDGELENHVSSAASGPCGRTGVAPGRTTSWRHAHYSSRDRGEIPTRLSGTSDIYPLTGFVGRFGAYLMIAVEVEASFLTCHHLSSHYSWDRQARDLLETPEPSSIGIFCCLSHRLYLVQGVSISIRFAPTN